MGEMSVSLGDIIRAAYRANKSLPPHSVWEVVMGVKSGEFSSWSTNKLLSIPRLGLRHEAQSSDLD